MTQRNGIVQFVCFAFPRYEVDAGEELRLGHSRNQGQLSRHERDSGGVAVGRRSQHDVFQSATHANVFFAQIWIKRADIPAGVDVQLNRGIADLEEPGLGVMRTGGENRGAHQSEWTVLCFAPVFPRLVSWAVTGAEDALIPSPPNAAAHDRDG